MALLTGKTAVITGGTTGIGLATARRFVEEGAHVFITGRRQAELDTAVKELGDQATGVQGDVSKVEDLGKNPQFIFVRFVDRSRVRLGLQLRAFATAVVHP